MKRRAALGSIKGRVWVLRIRIQSKVAVVVKLTLEGMREKETRSHLSKVRGLHMARTVVTAQPVPRWEAISWSEDGDAQFSGSLAEFDPIGSFVRFLPDLFVNRHFIF